MFPSHNSLAAAVPWRWGCAGKGLTYWPGAGPSRAFGEVVTAENTTCDCTAVSRSTLSGKADCLGIPIFVHTSYRSRYRYVYIWIYLYLLIDINNFKNFTCNPFTCRICCATVVWGYHEALLQPTVIFIAVWLLEPCMCLCTSLQVAWVFMYVIAESTISLGHNLGTWSLGVWHEYCAHPSTPGWSGWKQLCLKRSYFSVSSLSYRQVKETVNFLSLTDLPILYSILLAKHTLEISSGIHLEVPPLAWKYSTL